MTAPIPSDMMTKPKCGRTRWYVECCKTLALRRKREEDVSDSELEGNNCEQSEPDPEKPPTFGAASDEDEFYDCEEEPLMTSPQHSADTLLGHVIGKPWPCEVPGSLDCSPKPICKKPDFSGTWICVKTWGLEEFLIQTGISRMRRMAALRAPWPKWEFRQLGDQFVYVNRGALGAIQEEFKADGAPYVALDGWKQELACKAFWEDAILVIERKGPQGNFREERFLDADGQLQFFLRPLEEGKTNVRWGRTFEKARRRTGSNL